MRPAIAYIREKFIESGPLTGAEVGVYEGDHAEGIITATGPSLVLYLIDPWASRLPGGQDGAVWEERYQRVIVRFKDGPGVVIVRALSVDAAKCMDDEALDFVYIDGDHSYEAVAADLKAWWPKVKSGGVIAGHDYYEKQPGVVKAVDEFDLLIAGQGVWLQSERINGTRANSDWWIDKP